MPVLLPGRTYSQAAPVPAQGEIMKSLDLASLNPGIRFTVAMLRSHGFNTVDSGDGKTHEFECDQSIPYVHIQVHPYTALVEEADRLCRLLRDRGVSFADATFDAEGNLVGPHIEAHYSPADGIATISVSNVDDALLFKEQQP